MCIATSLAICAALAPSSLKAASVDTKDLFAAGIIQPSEQAIDRIESYQPLLTPLAVDSQKAWDRALLDSNDEALDEEFDRLAATQGMDRGAEQMLSWGVTRHLAGYIGASERYGRDLNHIGTLTDQPSLEEASLGIWFYLYAVTLADGHKCTDPSAPRQFMANTNEAYESIHANARTLEHATLVRLASDAAALEAQTAPDRVADPTICLAETAGAEMKPLADWQAWAEQTRTLLPGRLRNLADRLYSHAQSHVQDWFDQDLAASRIDLNAELEKANVDAARLDTAALFNGAMIALQLGNIEEAAFFFYAGQARRRIDEAVFSPGRESAQAITALNQVIGQVINPAIFREPDLLERVYKRLIAWEPVVEAGYSPSWPADQIVHGDEVSSAIKEQKDVYLEAMSPTVTLLQVPEYAEAVRNVQNYNRGDEAFREAPGAKQKYEAAEATMKRIENNHQDAQDR